MKIKKVYLLEFVIILFFMFYFTYNAYQQFNFSSVFKFSGILILFFSYFLTILGIHYIFNFFKDLIINKNKQRIKQVLTFGFYFFYLLTFMFLINKYFHINGQNAHIDMLTITGNLKNFDFLSYQGWYASIFYFIGYSLFPKVISNYAVVIFQIFLSSLFFTYVYNFFDKEKYKFAKLFWILCNIIFPATFFNQYCLRILWFAQITIILAIQIIKLEKIEEKNLDNKLKYIIIGLLAAIVGILRPEAIVYVPFIIFFIFIINKKITFKTKLVLTVLTILFLVIIRIPQNDKNEYKSTAILNPLSYLIGYDDLKWGNNSTDKENGITTINKIFDYDSLKKHSSYLTLDLAYSDPDAWNRNFSQNDFLELVKTYVKLIIYNPLKWLHGRYLTFSTSYSRIGGFSYATFFGKYIDNNIINSIIHFIYAPVAFLFLNFVAIIYYLFRKNKIKFVVSTFGIIEAIMIFIFGTSSHYMFIYPIWYIGCFISIIFISDVIKKRKESGK